MALEIEGRIARKLNVQTGTSTRGAWSKQEFVVEYQDGNFPQQICMNVWGEDKVRDLDKYQVGDKVKISFNLSSREYNGRWYTDVRAWRIEPAGQQAQYTGAVAGGAGYTAAVAAPQQGGYDYAQSAGSYSAPTDIPMPTINDMPAEDGTDDLPF